MKNSFEGDIAALRKAGVIEVSPDLAPFREACKPANLKFAEDLGGSALELYKTVAAMKS